MSKKKKEKKKEEKERVFMFISNGNIRRDFICHVTLKNDKRIECHFTAFNYSTTDPKIAAELEKVEFVTLLPVIIDEDSPEVPKVEPKEVMTKAASTDAIMAPPYEVKGEKEEKEDV